jgi:hypothetical protein
MKKKLVVSLFGLSAALALGAGAGESLENLAQNPGFEDDVDAESSAPVGWNAYVPASDLIYLTQDPVHGGAQSVVLTAQGKRDSNLGLMQEAKAGAGDKFVFSAFVMNNATNEMSFATAGTLSMEWLDDTGNEITREVSDVWSPATLSKKMWKKFVVSGQAPPTTAKVRFVISLFESKEPGRGACVVDDVQILAKNKGR